MGRGIRTKPLKKKTGNDLSLVLCPQSPHHTDKKNEEKNKWYKQVARKKKENTETKRTTPKESKTMHHKEQFIMQLAQF